MTSRLLLPVLLALLPFAAGADPPAAPAAPAAPAVPAAQFTPHQAPAAGGPDTCAFCHLSVPAPGAVETNLQIPAANLCGSCHDPAVHAGSAAHVATLPEHARGIVQAAGLRLLADGQMGCVTCHDPHAAGVLPGTDARRAGIGRPLYPDRWRDQVLLPAMQQHQAALGARLLVESTEPDLLRRPLAGGVLCETCHGGVCSDCHNPASFQHPRYRER